MTGILMLGGFTLFLINKKWSRIALLCLVPVCIVLAYFTSGDRMNMYAACAGIAIIASSPAFEKMAALIGGKINNGLEPADISGDDILDNKTKWRLIIAGYVVFILFAVFSVISIIRLNAKINTLYGFTQDLDQRIEEISDTDK